jgi:hypothetical protein
LVLCGELIVGLQVALRVSLRGGLRVSLRGELCEGLREFWTTKTHKTRKEKKMNLDPVEDKIWESVGNSVWDSVRDSVAYSVAYSVRDSVAYSMGYFVANSMDIGLTDPIREERAQG